MVSCGHSSSSALGLVPAPACVGYTCKGMKDWGGQKILHHASCQVTYPNPRLLCREKGETALMCTKALVVHQTMCSQNSFHWGELSSNLYIYIHPLFTTLFSLFIWTLDPKIPINNYWTLLLAILQTMNNIHRTLSLNLYQY